MPFGGKDKVITDRLTPWVVEDGANYTNIPFGFTVPVKEELELVQRTISPGNLKSVLISAQNSFSELRIRHASQTSNMRRQEFAGNSRVEMHDAN